jgi:hypothetical protein
LVRAKKRTPAAFAFDFHKRIQLPEARNEDANKFPEGSSRLSTFSFPILHQPVISILGWEEIEDDLAYFNKCAMEMQIEGLAQPKQERDTTTALPTLPTPKAQRELLKDQQIEPPPTNKQRHPLKVREGVEVSPKGIFASSLDTLTNWSSLRSRKT